MKRVFLSYSTHDVVRATELRDFLESNDISCWIGNRDILPGSNYTEEITDAISGCEVFVLLLSRNAQNSQYVISELEYAIEKGKTVIPYILEDFPISKNVWFHIRIHQGIFAYKDEHAAKARLLSGIRKIRKEKEPQVTGVIASESAEAHIPEISCPVCGSKDLAEEDPMLDRIRQAKGSELLTRYVRTAVSWIMIGYLVLMILHGIPQTRDIAEAVIEKIPTLGKYILSEGEAVNVQLLKIIMIHGAMLIPLVLISFLLDLVRAYYYKRSIQTGIYRVKYSCQDCRNKFVLQHDIGMLIERKNQIEADTSMALFELFRIAVYVLLFPMVLLKLGFTILAVVLCGIEALLTYRKTGNAQEAKAQAIQNWESCFRDLFDFPDLSDSKETINNDNQNERK